MQLSIYCMKCAQHCEPMRSHDTSHTAHKTLHTHNLSVSFLLTVDQAGCWMLHKYCKLYDVQELMYGYVVGAKDKIVIRKIGNKNLPICCFTTWIRQVAALIHLGSLLILEYKAMMFGHVVMLSALNWVFLANIQICS